MDLSILLSNALLDFPQEDFFVILLLKSSLLGQCDWDLNILL